MSHTAIPRMAARLACKAPRTIQSCAIGPARRPLLSHSIKSSTAIYRPFSTTPARPKKAKPSAPQDAAYTSAKAAQPTPTNEIYDLTGVETQILKAIEKLTHDLAQLRSSGRINPAVVEGLKVQLGTAGKEGKGKESVKLGDIAQVVPRGRMLQVICGEPEHIKPISSAIAASPHSLTPLAPEASAPLTIQVPLPPPTGESRRAAIDAATRAAEIADKWIQTARQGHNKKLRKYQLDKSVLPDDLQKAQKKMEDVVKKGHAEVKRIADGAKKVLDSQ